MRSSTIDQTAAAARVEVSDTYLTVFLTDGRSLSVPLTWYPRLVHGTVEERRNIRLLGHGIGIHWPDLDEDISINNLLAGKRSCESQKSFHQWKAQRSSAAV